jgi:transketolase
MLSYPTSTVDVLWTLYTRVLRVTPATADAPDRDRFLLSKGHAPQAYYEVLAGTGFIPPEWLVDLGSWDSPLGGHPDRQRIPGVEIASGSLGHGLPIGVGMALGLQAQGHLDSRVYVLVGDAELDEGSNHEAIAYAGAIHLGRLRVIVIDNQSATHGWPGGIAARFTVNGWTSSDVDGRDRDAIERGLCAFDGTRPHVTVARTERKEG